MNNSKTAKQIHRKVYDGNDWVNILSELKKIKWTNKICYQQSSIEAKVRVFPLVWQGKSGLSLNLTKTVPTAVGNKIMNAEKVSLPLTAIINSAASL